MSQMLKCPNPSCPYVFDPSLVPVGVVLSCPRCGMQFTLGSPSPAHAPAHQAPPQGYPPSAGPSYPTAPAGYPPGYAPPATPPEEPVNPELGSFGRTTVEEREPAEYLPTRGTNKAQVFILAGIASVLMAGSAIAVFFLIVRRGDSVSSDTVSRLHDYNIGVDPPPQGWTRDDNTRVKVGSPFVMSYKRENPEAYMAFGATEAPKGQSPRPSEMSRELREAFPRLFDLSTVREELPVESSWLGETIAPNHGTKFRAQSTDGLIWVGEAYTVSYKGIAYYWLSWCGENDYDALKSEFATFRGKFKLLGLRKDWKETQSNVVDFKGDTIPYTISDAENLWKEVPAEEFRTLKEMEPDLDKRMRIRITPKRDRHATPEEANMSVYLLDGGGEPTQVARKFAEEKETNRIKQANPDFTPPTFKELTDTPQGDPTPTSVHSDTPAVRLLSQVTESKSANRLIVTSGIKLENKIVVVLCWCEAGKRSTFETKFVQIATSLR